MDGTSLANLISTTCTAPRVLPVPQVQLEYNGLPAGNMEVDMRIEVEQRRSHDRPSHTGARSLMSRFSMSARHQSGVHAHSPPPWEPFGGAYGAGGMFMD